MAKFHGKIGFADGTVETSPGNGAWEEQIIEKEYRGDVVRNMRRLQDGEKVLDDLSVGSTSISIVKDAYLEEHIFAMRYIWWQGARWKISNVDASNRPRLVLDLGGVYNGPTPPVAP